MKSLIDYNEEIYKCSKCGLCQTVCPIYKATKNESLLSRGKFTLLNGITQKHLTLNKNVIKNLDLCLNCNACKDFCPSGINAKEIFAAARNQFNSKIFLNNYCGVYSSYLLLNILKYFITTYRLIGLDKLVNRLQNIFLHCGFFGKKLLLFNSIIEIKTNKQNVKNELKNVKSVVFFEGCFNKYINPSSKNACLKLINDLGYNIESISFGCCGISKYYNGQFKNFQQDALSIIKKIPDNVEYIISDCDSCVSTLKNYPKLFEQASKIENKIISLNDFLAINNYNKTFKNKEKITYHKPCHNCDSSTNIIEKLNNIQFTSQEGSNSCCGFAGHFGIKHNNLSTQISMEKAKNIAKTKSDYIVTSCPACLIGLKQGLIEINSPIKVISLAELLNQNN